MKMQNLKIKVNTAEESKEVQELLFELGYEWYSHGKTISYLDAIATNDFGYLVAWKTGCFSKHIIQMGCGKEDAKETTLAELRGMVNQEQDEPFLTPETTLNEQYAEIEQVRQAGLKLDNGKPRHSLLPKGSISSIIAVLEFGAKKYEANNWQKVDNAKERYYDAAMRHIDSWWNGEKFDQETGIHHLAHAATNLFFLKWFDDKENNNG